TPPHYIYPLSLHDALPICPALARRQLLPTRDLIELLLRRSMNRAEVVGDPFLHRFVLDGGEIPQRRGGDVVLGDQMGRRQLRLRSEEHTSELQSRGHLVCR